MPEASNPIQRVADTRDFERDPQQAAEAAAPPVKRQKAFRAGAGGAGDVIEVEEQSRHELDTRA